MSKKTVEQIVQQQQHYLIALKANQPTLYGTLQQLHQSEACLSQAQSVDHSHNRQVHRRVSVYAAPTQLSGLWRGLKCLIWVERWGIRDGQAFEENVGYISDLDLSAAEFLEHIQQHWSIENRLHWVRDVRFAEDVARPGGTAPVIWAILNCFLITIVRQLAYRTIPQGVRALTNQLRQVYAILTQGFPVLK
ncbi:MAG: ISAs1 family transposase [Scytolyngbya sp. HA4215-MV1]|nr:ISAs1 family transposase [Scytolyngbya sp. HA4215-MV1]